ncbi:MAG: hypothetical protein EF806_05720 [Candidatus Methanoliparum thermophilum]|uniref:PAS domain-containing protein n=1 Tax=Methanoliparum thermophilum TaxID=2491083 RepID=A0A520KR80_METT2|nr:hypothetical protein [Candidatus Methanoliparum sp. LAM-1]RZN64114.1 MAG: hypothetical protein EF806_05720 [Candidatus Methanoliparum thermophilum]BDC35623.1 hypothetical protein MTLP_03050 [Candidatus Methanoliparum sp. LAM-1]
MVNYLESVLEFYPDTLLVLDEKDTIRFISPLFEEDFGYDMDTFKKLDAERLIEKIVPSEERYIVENIKKSIKLGKNTEYMKYAKKFVDEYDKNKRYDV